MKKEPVYNIAPLTSGFMLTSMLGILISVFYLYPNSKTWGFTMLLMFLLMFIASLISMTWAPVGFSHVEHHKPKQKVRLK